MKVLWVVNTVFPDLALRLGQPSPVFGGWMYGAAAMLAKCPSIELSVATVYPGEPLLAERIGDIDYHLLTSRRDLKQQWQAVIDRHKPDVIHVHGTEYPHGLELLRIAPEIPAIVSIQGLVSVCARYYLAGLSFFDIFRNITFRDVVRMDTLFQQQYRMTKRGEAEREYISRATTIMGRTEWDWAHVEALRPNAPYVHCDEMLRDAFYGDERWTYEDCKPHSIFVSQASYPIKGLHQLIKAAVIVKRHYPDIEIRVAGTDITSASSWRSRIRRGGYGKYLRRLIAETGMQDVVKFLGPLDSAQMKAEYLRCNVSVCPSAIENSSNSIAEAQILGVPVIASQVGGIDTMTESFTVGQTYRFDEYEVLASQIRSVFSRRESLCDQRGAMLANRRHDRVRIRECLSSAYAALGARKVEARKP